ncbi:MAG: methyltransferase domain-containing protein [Symploca sp. SIO3C6]|uniref:Methyltransferase domain-containing protein n=1 Tax=Symploca sp. SIO1C4 TaxID=2607765 RepID=A0A6B3N5U7_9CYAN|nr:methyltransferase domain-containing protein [Symploca sp. SIO3C6]NER26933.1 methyltransferase domain-containing protein [Symploca sp. SIO1C4]
MNKDSICLNIGSGLVSPDGWKNIDNSPTLKISKIPLIGQLLISVVGGPPWPKSVNNGDIVKGLKISKGSCENIFASHVLEHLSLSDFHLAMSNIYSYLKPGGIFRAIVPDLEQYIDNYINHRSDSTLSAKAAHEFIETSWLGHPGKRSSIYYRLQEAFSNSRHQWMWDEPSLKNAFAQHGFKNIRRCNYGDWSDARFSAVDQESRYLNAISIEGTK